MEKKTFRMVAFFIGFVGTVLIVKSDMGNPFEFIGVTLCFLLIVFAYISTSKYGHLLNVPLDEQHKSFG